jgi:trans-aconitate 2-methyltransferase
MRWDPVQYERYADERARPFLDLLGRVHAAAPRRVLDVGCGPGTATTLLTRRWPGAAVEGIDSSAEMIAQATVLTSANLSFRLADAAEADPSDVDVLISNATLQWVPEHVDLLTRWAAGMREEAWLAFQVPGNFDSPSHTLMRELAADPRWADALSGVLRHHDAVRDPQDYALLLQDAGLTVDAWETTYVHVLTGDDPVLEWVRGTGLRPVLAALSASDGAVFEAEYAAALREAYPRTTHGTLFPFRRVFVVGHRAGIAGAAGRVTIGRTA